MNKIETIKVDLKDGKQSDLSDLHKKLTAENNKAG